MSDPSAMPREHPSPHRDQVRIERLILVLMAGPAAWIVQLVVGYGVASRLCRPGDAPRLVAPPWGWATEHIWLTLLNIACLLLSLGAGAVALGDWRRSREEKPGKAEAMLDVGEGRTRFLAGCGVLTSAAFAVAILFNTVSPTLIPACWRFP
jgi:hypothetical protein